MLPFMGSQSWTQLSDSTELIVVKSNELEQNSQNNQKLGKLKIRIEKKFILFFELLILGPWEN